MRLERSGTIYQLFLKSYAALSGDLEHTGPGWTGLLGGWLALRMDWLVGIWLLGVVDPLDDS